MAKFLRRFCCNGNPFVRSLVRSFGSHWCWLNWNFNISVIYIRHVDVPPLSSSHSFELCTVTVRSFSFSATAAHSIYLSIQFFAFIFQSARTNFKMFQLKLNYFECFTMLCAPTERQTGKRQEKCGNETTQNEKKKNGKKWYNIDAQKVLFVSVSLSLTVLLFPLRRLHVYRSTSEKKRTVNALEWREKCTEKKHMFAESSHLWVPVQFAVAAMSPLSSFTMCIV